MVIAWTEVIIGLTLLVFGADRFVVGAAQSARILGVSPLIIGLTIVGIATSAPEILIGSAAAFEGKTQIAIGNAIGSNIANIALVLGGAAMIRPVIIRSGTLQREYYVMLAATIIALLLMLDYYLGRVDASILLLVLAGALFWLTYTSRHAPLNDALAVEIAQELSAQISKGKALFLLIVGLLLLLAGAEILLLGAVTIAKSFGISDLVIGLTIIAVGTSLPELAASIISVIKNEADIAIGNIIGSNLFNMLAVLGVPVLIHPGGFGAEVLTRDFSVMLALTLLMGGIIFLRKKFNRLDGCFLLCCFVSYQMWLFLKAAG
jgi:cation:H+ antiporter